MKKIFPLLFLPFAALGQGSYPEKIDSLMQAECKATNFNGNVLVAKEGKIIYQHAFGFRNYDTKAKLDNNSVFELASVSKQFTAEGILMLVEKGKLKLTDSLRKFFPQLPYHNITIQHLLTHTSGLPDYEDAMDARWDPKKIAFNNDMIGFLVSDKTPADFAPDKKWEYSNTAFAILASIIEQLSGMSYAQFLKQNIFQPLGMQNTRVYNTRRSAKDTIANYAYGFVYADSLKQYKMPDSLKKYNYVYYLDGIVGDGCVNSTTGDLLKWTRALRNHTLLNENLQQKMMSPQSVIDTVNKSYYGYGEFISTSRFGDKRIDHSGGWPGYVTFLLLFPEKDITIIVLSNNESGSPTVANYIAAIMHDEKITYPYVHQEVTIDSALLDKYVGVYHVASPQVNIKIEKKDGKLYRRVGNTTNVILLIPEAKNKFFYSDKSDRQIAFDVDNTGATTTCWVISGGVKSEGKKMPVN